MDEKQKNAVLIAIMSGCITIILLMWILGGFAWYVQYPLTIILAGAIGAGAYFAAKTLT
jgi:lipoprotein signal peptidase